MLGFGFFFGGTALKHRFQHYEVITYITSCSEDGNCCFSDDKKMRGDGHKLEQGKFRLYEKKILYSKGEEMWNRHSE